MMRRRDVLNLSVSAAATAVLATANDHPNESQPLNIPIVDTNVSLFQWPFRRLPLDNTDALVDKLRTLGTTACWAGSFEGVLHRDVGEVNRRLAEECRRHREVVPFGTVNPSLPGWEEDLRQCIDQHRMSGIRLHPNYHGYGLNDAAFLQLLATATAASLLVQVAVAMEDSRTQHPMLHVPDVDLAPLPEAIRRVRGARVQILNHRLRPPQLKKFAGLPGLFFDTARVDGTDGIPNMVQQLPTGRVLFGTHAPFLIPEAALIRVHESDRLDDKALRAVLSENAVVARRHNS
jgi:predicted TIM-barrel fold metal-dependent hydrolase